MLANLTGLLAEKPISAEDFYAMTLTLLPPSVEDTLRSELSKAQFAACQNQGPRLDSGARRLGEAAVGNPSQKISGPWRGLTLAAFIKSIRCRARGQDWAPCIICVPTLGRRTSPAQTFVYPTSPLLTWLRVGG